MFCIIIFKQAKRDKIIFEQAKRAKREGMLRGGRVCRSVLLISRKSGITWVHYGCSFLFFNFFSMFSIICIRHLELQVSCAFYNYFM